MGSGRKRAAKSQLTSALALAVILAVGAAAPTKAQERLEQDFGVIRACPGAVRRLCDVANGHTGSTIYVGAPIGTAAALTVLLDGKAAPAFNECGSE